MKKNWKRLRDRSVALSLLFLWLVSHNFCSCWSLNDEGKALLKLRKSMESDPFGALSNWIDGELAVNPCSWSGVECSEGKVVALNLKDLCLRGTLPPELANLAHVKSIILRNNSFFGTIPEGMGMLTELEFLDLGYNNLSGPLPIDFGNNLSLAILLLDNNDLLGGVPPEIYELAALSECQVDESILSVAPKVQSCNRRPSPWNIDQDMKGVGQRRLQQFEMRQSPWNRETQPPPTETPDNKPSPSNDPIVSDGPAFPPIESSPSPFPVVNSTASRDPRSAPSPTTTSPSVPNRAQPVKTTSLKHWAALVGGIGGAVLFVVFTGVYLCKSDKVATVKPWATGLSGQLQKAFVTGVPKLKRSELEAACEDFSNVIGTSPIGTVYKGTLSSGVEIAAASMTVTSNKWSKNLEAQFRKKVEMLSKVNHKNFINLLGYCEEEEPFTRMVVFEYAPNGTLFEHLHIKESEHLDWLTRMRIATGMAYCLQHLHQLNPPSAHSNLNSSSVYLTEDYAAKLSELSFWNEITSAERKATGSKRLIAPSGGLKSNVYSFGVILFEMVTGQLPYSADDSSLDDWASNYLRRDHPLRKMVDPTLNSFREDQLVQVADLIKLCCLPNPLSRPTMKEICETLKKITGIKPEGAAPKHSPLWWAELEILSADGN